jgi:uncharacterized membrane protein YdjX (TVP38/TMEM64 family)
LKLSSRTVFQTAGLLLGIILLFWGFQTLPIEKSLTSLNDFVGSLGLLGLVLFIGIYALATVLLLPGSILTLGAGFTFGLGWGFLAVSLGSTLGAGLAFLLGRSVARQRVEAFTRERPHFQKLDRAIGREGARLIFLLRLSPVVPFNLSNYFYGLTAIRFGPYLLASWLGMMPGTLLYVYLGTLGRVGAEAAAGAGEGRSFLEWALLIAGLGATLAVTLWVTRLARRALTSDELE